MALGLTARVTRKALWEKGSNLQFLVVAAATIKDLNWKLEEITEDSLVAHTRVSLRSAGEEIRINFHNNIITIKSECVGIQPIAFGKNRANIKKFFKRFKEVSLLTTDNDTVKSYFILKERIQKDALKSKAVATNSKEKLTDFFAMFFSNKDFYFTSKILALNVLVYLVMAMTGAFNPIHIFEALYQFGGDHRGLINQGEWWRLFTSAFVHGGFLHLFFNMYAFLYVSLILEPLLGRFRYLAVYLFLTLASGMSSVYRFENILSVGASGAIFGLYGVAFAMAATGVLRNRIRISLLISIAVFAGYNIGFGIKDGIDYAAHIGGFSWGVVLGVLITPFYRQKRKVSLQVAASALFIAMFLSFSFLFINEVNENPAVFAKSNPYVAFISDSNARYAKQRDYGVYKDETKVKGELYRFWRRYIKAKKASELTEKDTKRITEKLKAGIYVLNKEILKLYHLLPLDISPITRNFIEDAAISSDALCQLYQGYLQAMENPDYNYRKSLRPLIARSQIAGYRLNDSKYSEYTDLYTPFY